MAFHCAFWFPKILLPVLHHFWKCSSQRSKNNLPKITKTKIGKLFLNFLDKHFPPHKKLCRLFNWNNVKVSYSCMPNMNCYTYMHNHKVLNDKPNETGINNCNCRNKDTCPPLNSCQTKCIIYQANIDRDIAGHKQKCYLGSCETTFKDRFGNHK